MKVRKLPAVFLAAALMLIPIATVAASAAPDSAKVTAISRNILVDGKEVSAEVYNIGGDSYFKLRDVAQLLNGTPSQFSLAFDVKTNTVTALTGKPYQAVGGELATGSDKSYTCIPGKSILKVNGLEISVSKYNIDGNNFFKLSDLGTAFGFAIGNNSSNAVTLTSGKFSLVFNNANYTVKTLTLGDQTITYRAYENIVYVSNPVDTKYEILNFFVPESYYKGETIGNYNARTAPIFFPNKVGGYNPGAPGIPDVQKNGSANEMFVALTKGYVVAAPGARGRTLQDENKMYTGKAPACIVDLKAAVRYLRYNDEIMPGSAEKIVSSGTSAGGALSSLIGVTGNNADYEPYLDAIGAADERDDVFAANSYCPITNLDNADTAYEWLFNGINTFTWGTRTGDLTADEIRISGELKALFPAYLNGLGLKMADGKALTLDANGDGTFKDYVKSFVIASAQKALKGGTDLSGLTWITIKDGTVTDIDFDKFIAYATRMKNPPAFDSLALKSFENNLFGTATIDNQHFSKYARDNSTADGTLADGTIVKMLNPMNYIGAEGTTTAQYWRIRHGAVDRDTSLAIPVILATKLQNEGFDVDFAMPWGQGHGGNYDLEELFDWSDSLCNPLKFHETNYTVKTTDVDGKTVAYRAYENIGYVKYPADIKYQYMNVYIPESVVNSQTAPIFFPNKIGGYMPAMPIIPADTASLATDKNNANTVSVALSKGYIVVSPGARGSASEVDGVFTGKAPAAIVDLKSAVRYLRYNDDIMPGNAEKIISDGTSAGGALSALLGASGNDALYKPYLTAIGSADERDDIFAAVSFCPITDLENSDMAYEWLYNRVNEDTDADGKSLYGFTTAQKELSAELKALYPSYLNGLGLKNVNDGTALTDANYEAYIETFVIASAQKALDKGIDISGKSWLSISNGKVTDVDFDAYLSYVTRMKMIKDPPAFDWLGDQSTTPPRSFGSRENKLFGTADKDTNVFTDFVANKLGIKVSQDVKDRVYLMNSLNFVGKEGSDNAPNWYIRHGSVDRDTAFTVPVSLYTKLMNAGTAKEVNFELAWEKPHSGDYDLEELFAWMGKVCK